MKYRIVITKQFRKAFKRIKGDAKLVSDLEKVIDLLIENKSLPQKYRDHKLTGRLQDFRELHVRSGVLLVYQKHKDVLILLLADLGSPSTLF